MIVINMYIAVLLENFNQAHHEEELGLGEEDLERFYAKWSRFDPYATQFIAFGELSDFVASLDPPLGISRPNMAALVNLDILIASGDRLHCLDILHALTRRVLGDVEDTEHFRKVLFLFWIFLSFSLPAQALTADTRFVFFSFLFYWKASRTNGREIQETISKSTWIGNCFIDGQVETARHCRSRHSKSLSTFLKVVNCSALFKTKKQNKNQKKQKMTLFSFQTLFVALQKKKKK